ncbi:sulfatase-like hydrolase/transferase [Rufibacter ruber]|uniref:sulfatase-like hydrolase/transferase n=1 Tax=Rufibacter ruber TaxID=1783499 RepID=UPI000A53ADB0
MKKPFTTLLPKSKIALVGLALLGLAQPGFAQKKKAPEKRPNIVLILADDLGFSDIGSYGGEIQTPHLDQLATNGLRFNQFYNASRCCPTRAALLTGLYNHQAGIGNMTTDQKLPGYRGYLTENTVTIAEVLKTVGYQTGMVGKWHVSNTVEKTPVEEHLRWQANQVKYPEFSPLNQ